MLRLFLYKIFITPPPTMQSSLTLNTIGTPFTLDMYSTFTTDSTEDLILDNIREEYPDITYDDLDWTYDMDMIHSKLADLVVDFMSDMQVQYTTDQTPLFKVTGVKSLHRPKYYNYTTDSADLDIEYDQSRLDQFIEENKSEYLKFCERSNHYTSTPLDDDTEKLYFYIEKNYDHESDNWIYHAFENINETMYNAISYEHIKK